MLVHHKVTLPLHLQPIYQASLVFLLLGGEKCFAQEHNTLTWPGVEARPLDPEPSALTIRSPYLLFKFMTNLSTQD